MSPPIVFVNPSLGATNATWNAGAGSLSVVTPVRAKPGDDLLLVIALRGAGKAVATVDGDAAFAGWTLVQTIAGANSSLALFRRVMDDGDIGTHVATFTAGAAGAAMMIALRGLQDVPATGALAETVGGTSFSCPAQPMSRATDAYLAIAVADVVVPTITVSFADDTDMAGGTDGTVGIDVVLFRPLFAGGDFGPKAATTGSSRSGFGASFALVADAVAGGLAISLDPPGTIGLPMEGV